MDKSWMSKPRTSDDYKDGVVQFLTFAFHNVRPGGKVNCPCVQCKNKSTKSYDDIRTHLRCNGILQGYTTWDRHGEEHNSTPVHFSHMSSTTDNPAPFGCPCTSPAQNRIKRNDDMEGLLNAAFPMADKYDTMSSSYEDICESNYETAPSSSDEGMDNNAFEFPNIYDSQQEDDVIPEEVGDQTKDDIIPSILKDAREKLYPGCDEFSKLSFVVTLFHLKCLHGWTRESFTSLLGVLSAALPAEANLPKNYHAAKKIIRDLGLDYVKIHACPKDCMLFYGDRAEQETCHVCNSSRWAERKNKGEATITEGHKKKPAKILRYFPLIPRLKRLYAHEQTSSDMCWHDKSEGRIDDGLLRHPADGQAWKDLDSRYASFAADPRNVRLGLSSDGVNPYRNMNIKHSTWPVLLIPYNLPPWICMKQTSFILSMVIPGPDSPGNDIDIYFQPLIDELLELWKGVETYDAKSKKKFSLKAALLWTLNDFPALANLYGWSTKGKYACPCCADLTRSIYLKKGHKCSYRGHRRWLPLSHPYRRRKNLFDGTEEKDSAPVTMSGSAILRMMDGKTFVCGKTSDQLEEEQLSGNKAKAGKKQKGKKQDKKRKRGQGKKKSDKKGKNPEDWIKKRSIFFELPYWEHNLLQHNLDLMHIEKNVCDNLIGTLLNLSGKTKDNLKARLDLEELGIRPELHPQLDDKGNKILPDAHFTMSRDQKEIFCSVIQNLRTPDGYASNLSNCVNVKECKLSGLKSHDCHVLIEEILPVALRSCFPSKDIMKIVVDLASFLKKLCSKVLDISELDKLQEKIVVTLCDMEKVFLPSFFTIMVHLLVHLVEEAKLGGPVHYRWMYPIERWFVRLKAHVRNRAHPEGSMAEGYKAEECLTFCSRFLAGTTRFTRPSRNPEPSDMAKDLFLFGSAGVAIGKATIVNQFNNMLLTQAHRYVLRHCDELEDFRREYVDSLRNEHDQDFMPSNAQELVDKHFADWLEQKILLSDDLSITGNIRALAGKPNKCGVRYSGFAINGFRFHTRGRESKRLTQNSGVVNTTTDEISYYGRLTDIIELSYKNDCKVVLFKCDWFDVHHRTSIKHDEFGFTLVNFKRLIHTGGNIEDDPFVFSSQVSQVFYVEDPKAKGWNVVVPVRPRDLFDMGTEQLGGDDDGTG